MKHIGIVAVSAPGAALCYSTICEEAAKITSIEPEISINALPFKTYYAAIAKQDWDAVAKLLLQSIQKLAALGAEFIVIPANTVHFGIADVIKKSPLEILNIIEVSAQNCAQKNYKNVAVLGTKFTMQGELYKNTLNQFGVQEIIIPENLQNKIHTLIIDHIIPNQINHDFNNEVVTELKLLNCDAYILACTELPIVMSELNLGKPAVDTTRLLAKAALEHSLD